MGVWYARVCGLCVCVVGTRLVLAPDVPVLAELPANTGLSGADSMFARAEAGDASWCAAGSGAVRLAKGDFALVRVEEAGVATLIARPLARTTITAAHTAVMGEYLRV